MNDTTRRTFLFATTAMSTSALVSACRVAASAVRGPGTAVGEALPGRSPSASPSKKKDEEQEVTATEDLMREHGILRRALVVYREAAARLRKTPAIVAPDALERTAKLFRAFGEEYHEKKLEEAFIFPAVKSGGGPAAAYPDALVAQHERGREIHDYILAVLHAPKIGARAAELAGVLESFARMYETHAAREDTILFPAWKKTMSPGQLDEMGDKFEEIERQQFGKDGFDDAVEQMAGIEGALGLSEIVQFTAPAPPRA